MMDDTTPGQMGCTRKQDEQAIKASQSVNSLPSWSLL